MPYKNREDRNRQSKEYYAKNGRTPEQHRKYTLWAKYRITPEDWDNMFEEQEGKCKICGRHQSEFEKTFAVDHDHETGQVRGLLCTECNLMLGYAHDRKDVLDKAIKYLADYDIPTVN